MDLKGEVSYLSGGELDDARNIVVGGTICFPTLMDAYAALTPHAKPLFGEIAEWANKQAVRNWEDDGHERSLQRSWDEAR